MIAFAFMLVASVAAHAVTPAVLIDEELRPQRVRLTGLRDGTLTYFDAERRLQRASVDTFVQLRALGEDNGARIDGPTVTAPAVDGGVLVLADGQRLAGKWAGASDDGGAVVWQHPTFGEVPVKLDRLRGWRSGEADDGDGTMNAQPAQDRVVLSNGDALEGFVTAVSSEGVSIQTANRDAPIELTRDRVSAVVLSNPAQRTAGRRTLVLSDGSVLRVSRLSIGRQGGGDVARFVSPLVGGEAQQVELDKVARLDLTGDGRRLVSLLSRERQVSGGEVFGLGMRPMASDGALLLHAPVTVTFDLPAGATRLAATAELAMGAGASSDAAVARWADLELVVSAGDDADGSDAARYRLHGGSPRAVVNTAVSAGRLRLTLEAGVNGPVLDRLRLRDAVILAVSAEPATEPR